LPLTIKEGGKTKMIGFHHNVPSPSLSTITRYIYVTGVLALLGVAFLLLNVVVWLFQLFLSASFELAHTFAMGDPVIRLLVLLAVGYALYKVSQRIRGLHHGS
jgi:hypothetical protein